MIRCFMQPLKQHTALPTSNLKPQLSLGVSAVKGAPGDRPGVSGGHTFEEQEGAKRPAEPARVSTFRPSCCPATCPPKHPVRSCRKAPAVTWGHQRQCCPTAEGQDLISLPKPGFSRDAGALGQAACAEHQLCPTPGPLVSHRLPVNGQKVPIQRCCCNKATCTEPTGWPAALSPCFHSPDSWGSPHCWVPPTPDAGSQPLK